MKFRPCIDIHNGCVKQIVGGSLSDVSDYAKENFVAEYDAAWYASYYKEAGLVGGHVILLNGSMSEYYDKTKNEALGALRAYPGGLMVGGGINPSNAMKFIDAGASHVIVTSYAFIDGEIRMDRIEELEAVVGKDKLCLDLSCRKKDGKYYVVTNRWQTFTNHELNKELLDMLSPHCDEFLIHAVDVEGKQQGIEEDVVRILNENCDKPVTYAGGISSFDDLRLLKKLGNGKIDATIGSALSIFGGGMDYKKVLDFFNDQESDISQRDHRCQSELW